MINKIDPQKLENIVNKIKKGINEINKKIIGQEELIKCLFIGLIGNGHILLEGVPGLAKTESVKVFSKIIGGKFSRVSFTPDLLPSDIIGGFIYNQQTSHFSIKKGPIFTNLLLGDEINRAPSKVQSSLLEAMQERQVTIGEETFKLPLPFLVMATQNPIEHDGTFPLPEAQIDRFLIKVKLDYPKKSEEIEIIKSNLSNEKIEINQIFELDEILEIQKITNEIYLDEEVLNYITDIIESTRNPESNGIDQIKGYLEYGSSPRGSIALAKCAQINALLNGKDYVGPDDVKDVAYICLRHRIGLNYKANSMGIDEDFIISEILKNISIINHK